MCLRQFGVNLLICASVEWFDRQCKNETTLFTFLCPAAHLFIRKCCLVENKNIWEKNVNQKAFCLKTISTIPFETPEWHLLGFLRSEGHIKSAALNVFAVGFDYY